MSDELENALTLIEDYFEEKGVELPTREEVKQEQKEKANALRNLYKRLP